MIQAQSGGITLVASAGAGGRFFNFGSDLTGRAIMATAKLASNELPINREVDCRVPTNLGWALERLLDSLTSRSRRHFV